MVTADTAESGDVLLELRRQGRVTQLLPPRLALVVLDSRNRADLASVPGVAVYTEHPPQVPDLTDGERIFIDAWWARRTEKVRPGDGLAWDAPGYLPPDAEPQP